MNDSSPSSQIARPRQPAWNKGKLTGPKPPLRPGHVWSIRAKLQLERRTRDLAVAPNGYAVDRATIRQRKTGRPVRFELTEVTRQALDDYLRESGQPKLARSISPASRTLIGFTSTPKDGATDWITANWPIPGGMAGSQRITFC